MRLFLRQLVILLLSSWLSTAFADTISPKTQAVCQKIYNKYPRNFAWDPLTPQGNKTASKDTLYAQTNKDYWNAGSSRNRAACVFFPANSNQVSYAVKALNKYEDVKYALKAGGHNSNFGFSSVNAGVLISFRPNLQKTIISEDRRSADIEPGSRWDEALTVLDRYGKAVVGGRLGHVGVAGYTLGGGLSFLTSQYGFAADNVINYELVLADGEIANANKDTNKDLFYALKGGGNQFGIVTKFTMRTHDIGMIWGGTKIYNGTQHEKLSSATTNFTRAFHDPKAAVIVTYDFARLDFVDIVVMFYFYDGEMPPAGVFDEFNAIPALVDHTSTQTYPALLKANNAFSLSGLRYQIREGTFPNLPEKPMTDFLSYHYEAFKYYAFNRSLSLPPVLDIKAFSFAIQPIPVAISQATINAGGNRLGLHPSQGDRIFMEYDLSWTNPACDNLCPGYLAQIVNEIGRHETKTYRGIKPTNYRSGDVEFISHNPIFMNDGMFDQEVLKSYGDATYQKLKKIQRNRDPRGFFSRRQDGFKFTS